MTWTAPNRAGIYKPKITVNDDPNYGPTNGRNDLAVSPTPVTITVVRPTVGKIQCQTPSGYVDMPETLFVLKGTTVNFKAVPTPAVLWPNGSPVWGESASGAGETTSVTFNTVSPSYFSPSRVSATAGNTVSAYVVVYDLLPVLTPEDNFEGRSQTRLGVGEQVNLSFTTMPASAAAFVQQETLLWSNTGFPGVRDDLHHGTATYYAGPLNSSVNLKLTIASGPSSGREVSVTRTIVEPDSTSYMRPHYVVAHDVNTCSVGFVGDIYLAPKDVSFRFIGFAEGGGTSTATGWLQPDFDNLAHRPTGGSLDAAYLAVGGGDINDGSKVIVQGAPYGDQVGFASYPRMAPAPPYGEGTIEWPISWRYQYYNELSGSSIAKTFMIATQYMTSDATGRATVSKAGSALISAEASDPTTAPPGWPGFPYPPQR